MKAHAKIATPFGEYCVPAAPVGQSAQLVFLTPTLAQVWADTFLDANNRKFSPRVVTSYRRDIDAGQWRTNGEPISFGANGICVNGEHRIRAFATASKGAWVWVIRGAATGVYDRGRTRSPSDAFRMDGAPRSSRYLSCLRMFGTLIADLDPTTADRWTQADYLATEKHYPKTSEWLLEITNTTQGRKLPCGAVGAIARAHANRPAQIEQMWEEVSLSASPGPVVCTLLKQLANAPKSGGKAVKYMTQITLQAARIFVTEGPSAQRLCFRGSAETFQWWSGQV